MQHQVILNEFHKLSVIIPSVLDAQIQHVIVPPRIYSPHPNHVEVYTVHVTFGAAVKYFADV